MLKMRKFMQSINPQAIRAQFSGLRGLHPGEWPFAPKSLCAVGVFMAAMAGCWVAYLSSQFDEYDVGMREEERLKEAYRTKIQQAISLDVLKKQKVLVGQYVLTLERQLPSKAEMDALLSDINRAGIGRGLQFELFKPGQVLVKDYYAELPIDIRVRGNYHAVAAFASDVASLPRIVTLNNMNLLSDAKDVKDAPLSLEVVAKTFRYLDAEEVATQKKAAAERAKAEKGAKKGSKK